jgi:hypothetical protein
MMIAWSMLAGLSSPVRSFDSHTKIRLCIPCRSNLPDSVSVYLLQWSSLVQQSEIVNDMDETINASGPLGFHMISFLSA